MPKAHAASKQAPSDWIWNCLNRKRAEYGFVKGGTSAEWILHERFFFVELQIFLRKNVPKFSPNFLSLYSVGQKNPAKFPPNFPPNLPAKNKIKKFTDELLQERSEKVSGSTVSNTELSEFFWAHWVQWSELSEFLSAYYLCAKANSPSFLQNSPSLPQNSVSSLFRNSTHETVFRPFPIKALPGAAEQLFTKPRPRPKIEPNFDRRKIKGQHD